MFHRFLSDDFETVQTPYFLAVQSLILIIVCVHTDFNFFCMVLYLMTGTDYEVNISIGVRREEVGSNTKRVERSRVNSKHKN